MVVPEFDTWTPFNNGQFGSGNLPGYLNWEAGGFTAFSFPRHTVIADPTAASAEATYSTTLYLEDGQTYSFAANAAERIGHDHTALQIIEMQISTDGGSTWTTLDSLTTSGVAPNEGYPAADLGDLAGEFTAPFTGSFGFRFRHSFDRAGVGNDISVTPPTVTCLT